MIIIMIHIIYINIYAFIKTLYILLLIVRLLIAKPAYKNNNLDVCTGVASSDDGRERTRDRERERERKKRIT